MKRRDFFKTSTAAVSALALPGISAVSFNKLLAGEVSEHGSFSFEIITDRPEDAIKLSERFFKNNSFYDPVIKFSEYSVEGEMNGDIVFVREGKLINYKSDNTDLNNEIRSIAGSLSLPKKLVNPVRIKFYQSGMKAAADRFLIFHKNILIRTLKTDSKNLNLNIEGTKGNILLNIENKKARVINSSCAHKTCINSGSIAFPGESIVCIPNELMILCE